MFNSNLRRVFDEDPFFSDPFQAHRDHMRQMMRSFSEPFGGPTMPSITDGRQRDRDTGDHPHSSRALQENHRDMSRSLFPFGSSDSTDAVRNPFSLFDNMMVNVRNRMGEMNRNFENVSLDSNTHSFSSSSIMTYSKVGNEPPKVFQASSSTRCAPGGIKETRRAVKDSESGVEKMAIGHHIHERGHVVEKKYNKKTGDKELNQNFQNMDESEGQSFEDEWQQKVSKFHPSDPVSQLEGPRPRKVRHAAITGGEQPHRNDSDDKAEGKSDMRVSEMQ
ncbi:myeloid leukemia factor 1 isoform X2 [Takifugu flavidus]|uniref:myeloid leukemia factor 1 isoform X2 n=1 Tax=Takifugu flavidus TaxID=433684 RepID=UPI0025440859|nr:myeloid leukemia factor 1 isoform X2 [Takifugu flavidus]